MNANLKGISPFYPGQPVPPEYFTGRREEIERIIRTIRQVESGKQQAVFLTGEYGIGKSSLASFMRFYAEQNHGLLGIHTLLGAAETIEDVATRTIETVIKEKIYEPTFSEDIRNFFSKYIGKQELFGFNINLEGLKADAPAISTGYLPFLRELVKRFQNKGVKGILLILDEINGISRNPKFAHFIKTLVDENAISREPLPLLLMLCGVEERRSDLISSHQPIERIFDVVEIKPMDGPEMKNFFDRAFASQGLTVEEEAMTQLCHFSAGYPKIMHVVGDATFWANRDMVIDDEDALDGVFAAAEDVGRKFVDQQVLKALKSRDYHSILNKLAKMPISDSFMKTAFEAKLSDSEKKKFNNFLQRMKKLKVLRSGELKGEYIFNSRLVRLYILLNSAKKPGS